MMQKLIEDIQAFLEKTGVAPSTFGRLSVNDGKMFGRLLEGGQCLPSTEKRIREFMSSYKSK